MRASSAFTTFVLLHFLLHQICNGKESWEFGRRVKSTAKEYMGESNTRNPKKTNKLVTADLTRNGETKSRTALHRVRLSGMDSSTTRINQRKTEREKIPVFFENDLEDGSRKLVSLSSYTYSQSSDLMAEGRVPQMGNTSSTQTQIKYSEGISESIVTKGLVPASSIQGQNITDSFLKEDLTYTKVTCPLTEMKTPANSVQKVTIRFTYEVDTNNTSFSVSDIESMMFQSVVETLLDCGKTRQLLRNMRGRRKLQEDLQFLAIDSMPGDNLRANETCTPLIRGSSCHIIDGSMTVEINQAGEEAGRNAELKVLQLLSGFMKYGTYTSAEYGIAATRYVSPDLATFSSMVSTIRASAAPSTSLHRTALLFSCIGVGLLAIILIATHHIRRQRVQWRRLSNEEVTSSDPKYLEGISSDSDFVPSTNENCEGLVHHPEGYTELAEDDTLGNTHVPPGVCFDEGFLVSPSMLDAILERDEDIQESSTTDSSIQKPSEF